MVPTQDAVGVSHPLRQQIAIIEYCAKQLCVIVARMSELATSCSLSQTINAVTDS